jgi:hypothetical protein
LTRCVSATFASVVAAAVGGSYLMWVCYVNPESALGPVALSKVRKELIATAVIGQWLPSLHPAPRRIPRQAHD